MYPPDVETIPNFLRHVWSFDVLKATDEDRKRTQLYQQQARREQLRQQTQTVEKLVGVLLFRAVSAELDVDTFLLSCRVLGRRVEHSMLSRLGQLASARGLERVKLRYQHTEKNKPAQSFLEGLENAERQWQSSGMICNLSAADAIASTTTSR